MCVCVCCVELGRGYILVCMFVCLHSPFLVWQGRCGSRHSSCYKFKVSRVVQFCFKVGKNGILCSDFGQFWKSAIATFFNHQILGIASTQCLFSLGKKIELAVASWLLGLNWPFSWPLASDLKDKVDFWSFFIAKSITECLLVLEIGEEQNTMIPFLTQNPNLKNTNNPMWNTGPNHSTNSFIIEVI